MFALVNVAVMSLLARAPDGGLSLEVVLREHFTDALLAPLYQLSNAFMAEPFEHFLHHARTNDQLHIFRRVAGQLVGFQLWRAFAGRSAGERFVLGGKLRILPEARRQGLHLASGLSVLLSERQRFPEAAITRLGVASLFGFVSIVRRVARYDFVNEASRPDLIDVIGEVTHASRYTFDASTGLVRVGIFITPEQLLRYPPSYFESPAARAYCARNPAFRTNGSYLAFAFEVDRENLAALAYGAAEAVLCCGSDAHAAAQQLLGGL